jgi:hypothetical protein
VAVLWRSLLIFVAITFGSLAQSEPVYLGETAIVSNTWYACQDKDALQYLKSLSAEQWSSARAYAEGNHCQILKAGDTGVVVNARVSTGDTCLRLMESLDCQWFPENLVVREDSVVGSTK